MLIIPSNVSVEEMERRFEVIRQDRIEAEKEAWCIVEALGIASKHHLGIRKEGSTIPGIDLWFYHGRKYRFGKFYLLPDNQVEGLLYGDNRDLDYNFTTPLGNLKKEMRQAMKK